jgi:hypothetical protein|tara:strand:+ start:264 stop:437 length:174 start_codon:yes stop_codon:yes gene_type:complete
MATRYKLYPDDEYGPYPAIQRTLDDGTISSIPMSEENTDYLEYLEWVKEGNTPEAAD